MKKDLQSIMTELETPLLEEPTTLANDIEKLATLMEDQSGMEKFAEGIKLLALEYRDQSEKRELAESVVEELLKQGSLDNSKIFSKLSELQDMDKTKLNILNEALKLNKTGSFDLGALSDLEEPVEGYGSNATEALKHIIEKVKEDSL